MTNLIVLLFLFLLSIQLIASDCAGITAAIANLTNAFKEFLKAKGVPSLYYGRIVPQPYTCAELLAQSAALLQKLNNLDSARAAFGKYILWHSINWEPFIVLIQ